MAEYAAPFMRTMAPQKSSWDFFDSKTCRKNMIKNVMLKLSMCFFPVLTNLFIPPILPGQVPRRMALSWSQGATSEKREFLAIQAKYIIMS